MGNLTASPSIREKTIHMFNLIDTIHGIVLSKSQLDKAIARNFVWVASNLCEETKKLEYK